MATREEMLKEIRRERMLAEIRAARAEQKPLFDLNVDGDAKFADWEASQQPPAEPPTADEEWISQLGDYASSAGNFLATEAKDIGRFAKGMMTDPDARDRAVEVGQGALRQAASGFYQGGYDEAKGMEQGVYAHLRGEDYGEAYDKEKLRVSDLLKNYNQEFPDSSTVANVGGGMLNPINALGGGALKNMAVDTFQGATTGALSAEEGDRISGAIEGGFLGLGGGRVMATLGKAGSGVLGYGQRVARELGDKIEDFVPVHLLADSSNPILRNFYQKIVGPSTGADELIEQQARAISREEANLARATRSGKQSVSRQKGDIDTQKRTAVEGLEGQSEQVIRQQQTLYRHEITSQAMPPGVTPAESEAIHTAMLQGDTQVGMGMLHKQWNEKGFENIKTREFEISEEDLLKEIRAALPAHMEEIFPRASQMIKSALKKNAKPPPRGLEFNEAGLPVLVRGEGADKISGLALMDARNELRMLVNELGDSGDAALQKAGYAKAANKIDDIIKRQLPKKMRAAYEDELTKWGIFLTARDATGKAGVRKQGLFDADDILVAEKSNVGSRFSEGRSPLYRSAQAQQRAVTQEGKALKKSVAKRKDEAKAQKEVVKTPAVIQKEIDAFAEKIDTFKRKSSSESKNIFQSAFANALLTSPIHAVTHLLFGSAGLAASVITTPLTATAIGKFLSKPGTQRYFAGQAGFQKNLRESVAKMDPKLREIMFRAMPVAVRNEYIMNDKDDDIDSAKQTVGRYL